MVVVVVAQEDSVSHRYGHGMPTADEEGGSRLSLMHHRLSSYTNKNYKNGLIAYGISICYILCRLSVIIGSPSYL